MGSAPSKLWTAGDIAQSVECLPVLFKVLGPVLSTA